MGMGSLLERLWGWAVCSSAHGDAQFARALAAEAARRVRTPAAAAHMCRKHWPPSMVCVCVCLCVYEHAHVCASMHGTRQHIYLQPPYVLGLG